MKKLLPLFLVLAGILIAGLVFFVFKASKTNKGPAATPTPEGVLLETPFDQRPYVSLIPRTDGRELTLTIDHIQNAATIEYELLYLSNDLSRGVIGAIKLKPDETKVSRNLLLGSCSKNVCKYDENVSTGTLTLRFRSPEGTRKFIADFRLQQGVSTLMTPDEKFKLAGVKLSGVYTITMNTIGAPDELTAEPFSKSYAVFPASSRTMGIIDLELGLDQETPEATLYGWSGKAWQAVKSQLDGQTITAQVDNLGPFIITN